MKSPFAYMWKAHSYMWKSHSLTWWTSDSGWIILQFKSIKIYFSDQVNAWKYRESVNHRTILDSVGPFCPNYSETGKLVWTLFLFLSATHSLSADVTSLRAKCVLHIMEVVFSQMESLHWRPPWLQNTFLYNLHLHQVVFGHVVTYVMTSLLAIAGNFLVILAILLSNRDAKLSFLPKSYFYFCFPYKPRNPPHQWGWTNYHLTHNFMSALQTRII